MNRLDYYGGTDINNAVIKMNDQITGMVKSGRIPEKSVVTIYFLTDNEDDKYNPEASGNHSKARDAYFKKMNVSRFVRYWELGDNSEKLAQAIGFDPKIDIKFGSLEDEKAAQ